MTQPLTNNEVYPYRGFESRDPSWDPILEEWLLLVERYSRIKGGAHSSFGFGERANVSLLAGAAWRCGYICMTEFAHEKLNGEEPGRGRADLEISSPERRYMIEAKNSWLWLTANNPGEEIAACLGLAISDARRTIAAAEPDPRGEATAYGAAFIPTHIRPSDLGSMSEGIHRAVDAVRAMNSTFSAWCFPVEERTRAAEGHNYTPGVILVGSEAMKETDEISD